MVKELLIAGAGSCLGGMARYAIALAMKNMSGAFPWATFTANILGCLLIGLLWGTWSRWSEASSSLYIFLTVGFCGGFTTFSTFSKESLGLLQQGSYASFGLYALGSMAVGILAVAMGYFIAKP